MDPTAVIVMGVAGSGKSTIGALVAKQLGWQFVEGDSFHSAENVAKMAAGHPLTDEDRAPWLAAIRDWIAQELAAGRSCVVTCSALKRSYRDVLRSASATNHGTIRFAYLDVDRSLLRDRLNARHGHYMYINMLASQLHALPPPNDGEHAITKGVDGKTVSQGAINEIIAKNF